MKRLFLISIIIMAMASLAFAGDAYHNKVVVTQDGDGHDVKVDQYDHNKWNWNSVNIDQDGADNNAEVTQGRAGLNVGYGNDADIDQAGENGDVDLIQSGNDNSATLDQNEWTIGANIEVEQSGNDNTAKVEQGHYYNDASVKQHGNNGYAQVEQFLGERNEATIEQAVGSYNSDARIKQLGTHDFLASRNNADIFQDGDYDQARIIQEGQRGEAQVMQIGDRNNARVEQAGAWNTAFVKEVGNGNTATVKQPGSHNDANISQRGNGNTAATEQAGNYNIADIDQGVPNQGPTASNNQAYATQDGYKNLAKIYQRQGANNYADISQTGDWNNNDVKVEKVLNLPEHGWVKNGAYQFGDNSWARFTQNGNLNAAAVHQGDYNKANVTQNGNRNTAVLNQAK